VRELERLRLRQLALEAQGDRAAHPEKDVAADQDRLLAEAAAAVEVLQHVRSTLEPESRLPVDLETLDVGPAGDELLEELPPPRELGDEDRAAVGTDDDRRE
jgi:ABC-type phosphate transport system auxiliary subunit